MNYIHAVTTAKNALKEIRRPRPGTMEKLRDQGWLFAEVSLFCVIAWKLKALPEALGSMTGVWLANTKPVDNFIKRIKRAAMDAALYGNEKPK